MIYVAFAVAAWLFLIGLYGIATSRHLVHLCGCLAVMQASTYVLLAAIGYRPGAAAPILVKEAAQKAALAQQPDTGEKDRHADAFVDPVVQALMLTDIVVEATAVALLLALAVQIQKRTGSVDPEHIDYLRG